MQQFNLILGILNTFGLILLCWLLWRLNKYINKIEYDIEQTESRVENNEIALREAIKEDYLEPGKNLRVKKAKISKQQI